MSKVNKKVKAPKSKVLGSNNGKTFEGAPSVNLKAGQLLRRAVCASMLFEDTFYESGEDIAKRIQTLAAQVHPDEVNAIIKDAKFAGKLRHTPLFLAASAPDKVDRATLASLFTRPDDITDYISLWWKNGKKPLKKKMKLAISDALNKFDAYQLAKYKGSATDAVKMVDVFNLCHPKPKDTEQAAIYRNLMNGTLNPADTWEKALSSGEEEKSEAWARLMAEKKLGGLAFFRNLRNMLQAGIPEKDIIAYMREVKTDRLLPINMYAAGRIMGQHSVKVQAAVEDKLFDTLKGFTKMKGKTAILVDTSGSMWNAMAGKSKFERGDYALALAMILQAICEKHQLIFFQTTAKEVKGKTGFALYDEARRFSGGTDHAAGLRLVSADCDRVVMITDEQSSTYYNQTKKTKNYMINVAPYESSISYGNWVSITGFSEKVIDFIREYEEHGFHALQA
jgi:60 kDa SS-A/Ro ribonucleoprotein